MKKRIWSILLTLCMVLAMMPMTAFAVEDPPPSPPAISSIVASNAGSTDGLGVGDTVTITFDQNTNKQYIPAATIDSRLKLNNGHSWGTGLTDGYIAWNAAGNILIITFNSVSGSTIAVGDTITLDSSANIKDSALTTAASTASGTVTGTFSVSLQSLIDAAASGGAITLNENINLGSTGVTIADKNITLNLNGKTITYSGTGAAVTLSGTASLTVQDGSTGGTITSASNCSILKNSGSGTLTLAGGAIEGTGTGYTTGIENSGTGRVNITGGTVQTTNGKTLRIKGNSDVVSISGGTLRATLADWFITFETGSEGFEFQGGTIVGDTRIECRCPVVISGGYIGSDITITEGYDLTITGGILGGMVNFYGSHISVTGGNISGFDYYGSNALSSAGQKRYQLGIFGATGNTVTNAAITSLSTDTPLENDYGLTDVKTNKYGYLNFWLPAGKTRVSVTADGNTYSGTVSLNAYSYYEGNLRLASQNPAAATASAAKATASQASVDFTLTTPPAGTWKVYGSADANAVISGVTAALSGTTLTLIAADGDLEAGTYYITVTESNKNESARLALTVQAATVNAAAPVITNELSTTQVEYSQNAAAAPLDATATASDGGTVSYAWYSNTTNSTAGAIALGETNATYTPPTATTGDIYYYCVVTNTNNAATGTKTVHTYSAIANIKVNAPADAAELAVALGSNAAASGNTVTLTGNVADVAETIQIEPSENIILNLAGYTISGKNGTGSGADANGITPLEINSGTGTLTITGNGRILGGSVELFDAADAITISGGTVVIENGTITGGVSTYYSYGSHGDGIEMSSGNLTISGGAIKGGISTNEYNYAGNGLNISGGTVTIYDGSFYSGTDHWNNSRAIYASGGTETAADILTAGKIMKSYADEDFTTGETVIADNTLISALTSKYIKVENATYAIQAIGNQTLTALTEGYGSGNQQTKTVAITKSGTGNLTSLATVISGANADSFTITQPIATTLDSGTASTTFTVKANDGLAEGTYTATVTISAANMTNVTFTVTQVVNPAGSNIYTISADTTPFHFGSKTAGYGTAPAAQTVTITNTGNQTITLTEPSTTNSTSNYNIGSLSATTLAAGGTATFTLQPKTGLAVGTYNETIDIAGSNGSNDAAASVTAQFSVNSSGGGNGGGGGGGSSTPATVTKIESGESVVSTNLDNLVKEGKKLTVEGKAGEKLVLDTEALKNIDGQTKDSLKVEIKDVSTNYKNEHPDRLVVSLTITAGGKHITSFGKGTATVSLPYELKEGEKAKDVTVWYLAEDGTMTEVPCTYDPDTKLATFKVNHFSLYVVGTADTSTWTNPFSDVKESSWYFDAVRYVSANELMNGTTDTAFNPGAKTTRGMIVTILWRMENEPKASKEMTFTDVKDGRYYHDAVAWASENGIVGGYSTDLFGAEDNITREQLAVILHNYASFKGYTASASGDLSVFDDSGKVHSWSKDSLSWANAKGLINGTGSNLLDPLGAAERSQVAAILQRFIENTAK